MPSKAKARGLKDIRKPDDAVQVGSPMGEIVLYSAPDGTVELNVRLERETIWLTQKQMSELFDTERSVITKHLKNIFVSSELDKESNVQKKHIPFEDDGISTMTELVRFLHQLTLHVLGVNNCRGLLGNSNG